MSNNATIPLGLVWRLVDTDIHSQHFGASFRFDFSYITNEEMRHIVQQFVWKNHLTQNRTLSTLHGKLSVFKHFYAFACSRGVFSFKEMSNDTVTAFLSYLRTTVPENSQTALSYSTQKCCLDSLKAIVRWGQIHMPDMFPSCEIFTGQEYRSINKNLKIDFIPDSVISQVNKALLREENPYIKYGIIICECTGMRSGDMLLLEKTCIEPHPINGYLMKWYEHKKRKDRTPIPITSECATAVSRLLEITDPLREDADASINNRLFIYQPAAGRNRGRICSVSRQQMMRWLKDFVRENDITDSDGTLYDLTFHKFRRTLATDMFSKGINIKVIQEALGHISATTTRRYYADVKDKERTEMFDQIGILGNIRDINGSLIPNIQEFQWFLHNMDGAARMCDGYCSKPVNGNELCERLLKRQKCYTCSRYITTLDDIEYHKKHLQELESMVKNNLYGDHFGSHFSLTIRTLKEIIQRLEALRNENK